MFRRLADFERTWERERESTLRLLRALTDESLARSAEAGGRSLGRLAWHLTLSIGEMMRRTGLGVKGPPDDAPPPSRVADVVAAYEQAAASLDEEIRLDWSDATLDSEDEMFGERWKRGFTLFALVTHQAHHRGQMTVLMREAGLRVPALYGPAREDWAAHGMEPPAV